MSFISLILKNLVRQRIRTALTVLGISVGIATVVALGVVVGGVKETAASILRAYGADFIVAQKGSSDLSFSSVPDEDLAIVDAHPGVERTIGVLMHISKVGSNPYFVTIGVRPDDLGASGPALREGRYPATDDEMAVGTRAASDQDLEVGDTVRIDTRELTVTGIYDADNIWEDAGGYAPLSTVQAIARKPGVVTLIYVVVEEGADPQAVAESIEDTYPTLTSVASVDEYSEVDQGIEIMDALNLAISALAVGIGAIGVMNTMIMSVFERTREIGILRAVGWRSNRIIRLVLGESLFLCMIAAGVGSLLGVLASRAVLLIPAVRSLLEPSYTTDVFVRALVVAVIVAFVGAIYPAVRAVRLSPMEALRHE